MARRSPERFAWSPRAFLGDHGHRLVGEFATMAAAQRALEIFSRRWMRGRTIEECDCDVVLA
jgi:hypothetical protein